MMKTQGPQLEVEGRKAWTVIRDRAQFVVGFFQNTTTPDWFLVRCWVVGLHWPIVRRAMNHFVTPTMLMQYSAE